MLKKKGYCIFQTMYASSLTAKYLAQQTYFPAGHWRFSS